MGKKYLLTIEIPEYRPPIENAELSSPVQHNASPDKNSRTTVMVSFLDVTGIKPCPDLSPNQNALRITSGTEPTLIRKEDTTPLINCPVFVCSLHHCKRWRRWSTFNGRQSSDGGRIGPLCEGVRPYCRPRADTTNLSNSCICGLERFPSARNDTFVDSELCSYTGDEAWRVGRLEGGQTQAEVAKAIGVSQSVISRIWNRFLETGSAGRRPGQGRRVATKPNEDRDLVLTARRHRNMNATPLQQHLRSVTGTTVSTQTVRNWLHGVCLYTRRPMVCVRLTSSHRRDRREWATEHVNWRRNEWSNVLFSDESRFSVHPDNRRIFIWRECGSRNNPAFVHESVRFGGGGVLVYGGISIDGCTDPYIIRDGPLTARRYRDEILRPIVVPYAAAIEDDFILMDDNCRPYRANLVEDFLFEEGIVRMEWPACSPDTNPIEHVWNALGRRVVGRQPPPQTLQELERALLEEWDRIPQLVINSLIDSMPQRCSTLLAANSAKEQQVKDSVTKNFKFGGPRNMALLLKVTEPCGFYVLE
ncbi:transposable element Tcb2 transposase [Trichonephila clavipes]|nr:transposable element Tcb2 transposase [Trichonephila clavipes]